MLPLLRCLGVRLHESLRTGRPREYPYVMDDRRISGAGFDRLDPFILREFSRHREILPGDLAGCRDMKLLRHFEYEVGIADAPSLRKRNRFWSILRISGGRALIHPRDQGIDLLLRQPAVIGKRAGRGVGEPRGHFSCQDGLSNGLRPRPHFLISRHGKRRGFPCAMTDLTSLL